MSFCCSVMWKKYHNIKTRKYCVYLQFTNTRKMSAFVSLLPHILQNTHTQKTAQQLVAHTHTLVCDECFKSFNLNVLHHERVQ